MGQSMQPKSCGVGDALNLYLSRTSAHAGVHSTCSFPELVCRAAVHVRNLHLPMQSLYIQTAAIQSECMQGKHLVPHPKDTAHPRPAPHPSRVNIFNQLVCQQGAVI